MENQFNIDPRTDGLLREWLRIFFPSYLYRSRKDSLTIRTGETSFNVTSNYMVLTGPAGGATIATIVGGYEGQILTLQFVDGNITITDTATGALNTVNLSAAFTGSAEDTMQLIYNGTSWREICRSVN
jgi:hypothetical protein